MAGILGGKAYEWDDESASEGEDDKVDAPKFEDSIKFVGAIDLRALAARLHLSEPALCNAIFDGLPSRPAPILAPLRNPYLHMRNGQISAAASGDVESGAGGYQEMPSGEEKKDNANAQTAQRTVQRYLASKLNEHTPEVALVTAARTKESVGPSGPAELLKINGRSTLVHSLLGLEQAGIRIAIIVVGAHGKAMMSAVETEYQPVPGVVMLRRMRIKFVDLGEDWKGTPAESILRARSTLATYCGGAHFPRPFLLVSSARMYEPNLIRYLVTLWGVAKGQKSNLCLMDDPTIDHLAHAVRSEKAVRVLTEQEAHQDRLFQVKGIGHHIPVYNGVEVGLFRLNGHQFFSEMEKVKASRTISSSDSYTEAGSVMDLSLTEILDNLACQGLLFAVPVGNYNYASFETPEEAEESEAEFADLFFPPLPASQDKRKRPVTYTVDDKSPETAALPRVAIVPVPEENTSLVGQKYYEHAAILPPTVDPIVRKLSDKDDVAILVRNEDGEKGLPENALILPARLESGQPLIDEEDEPGMCRPGKPLALPGLQVLRAQLGLELPSDITGMQFSIRDDTEEEHASGEKTLIATIQHEVPVIGWIMLIVAALAAGSSGLVIKTTAHKVSEGNILAWRYLAATIVAIPIAIYNACCQQSRKARKVVMNVNVDDEVHSLAPSETTPLLSAGNGARPSSTSGSSSTASRSSRPTVTSTPRGVTTLERKPRRSNVGLQAKAAVVVSMISYWICTFAFVVAIRSTSQQMLVMLVGNLAPLIVLLSGMAGCAQGNCPTVAEVIGCLFGLGGAAVCLYIRGTYHAIQAGHSDALLAGMPSVMGDWFAIGGGLISSIFHAVYIIFSKIARKEVSAPTLHVWMQTGAAVLTLVVLYIVGDLELSFDPHDGVFGFLYPDHSRLYAWLWMGAGVDTLGTLGYTAVIWYVRPLMVAMVALLQGSIAIFEGAALGIEERPSWSFIGGTVLLLAGAFLVGTAQGGEQNRDIFEFRQGGGIYGISDAEAKPEAAEEAEPTPEDKANGKEVRFLNEENKATSNGAE